MSKKTKEEILDDNGYRGSVLFDELCWSKEIEHKKRRLLISYSGKRAAKTQQIDSV